VSTFGVRPHYTVANHRTAVPTEYRLGRRISNLLDYCWIEDLSVAAQQSLGIRDFDVRGSVHSEWIPHKQNHSIRIGDRKRSNKSFEECE